MCLKRMVILTQTLGEEFSYCTLGLRPRVQYENSSPWVWVRITILLPPLEGGMYHSFFFETLATWSSSNTFVAISLISSRSFFSLSSSSLSVSVELLFKETVSMDMVCFLCIDYLFLLCLWLHTFTFNLFIVDFGL